MRNGKSLTRSDHLRHDRLLVTRFAMGDSFPAEKADAQALVQTCNDCAALAADIRLIAASMQRLPRPRRRVIHQLTAEQAERLGKARRSVPLAQGTRRTRLGDSAAGGRRGDVDRTRSCGRVPRRSALCASRRATVRQSSLARLQEPLTSNRRCRGTGGKRHVRRPGTGQATSGCHRDARGPFCR